VCPSFVADCLETLEEVQIRGRDQFLAAGGEELALILMNSKMIAGEGMAGIVREFTSVTAFTDKTGCLA